MIEKTVCFTGHRPQSLGGYNENSPMVVKIKARLKHEIEKAIEEGFTYFISGGALGVDQWAAEAVIELKSKYKIKLIIARPFPCQSLIWPQEAKIKFNKLCSCADSVIDVSPDPYAAWKLQKRNEYMIDHSSLVIALWNGSSGGTANAVQYAVKKHKRIIQVNPNSL